MSLLDRAIACPGFDRRPHTPLLHLCYPSIRLRKCCYAKVKLDDDEQESQTPHRGFSIRVPTIPKLGDIESARRLLESAFQALSFDMPKIPIDSALQSLPFGIPNLSNPVRVLVLDITGFVVTKLKKPQKKVLVDVPMDEKQYPRCAWPRTAKGRQLAVGAKFGLLVDTQDQETSNQVPMGPHCAWPRTTSQFTGASGFSSTPDIVSDVLSPRSAWPRKSVRVNGVLLAGQQPVSDSSRLSVAKEEESSSCVIEGGPRCAWPRRGVSAKQSHHAADSTNNAENHDVSQRAENLTRDEAAELPRRMLATSVGLTVMNQLAKGSIATSVFDFCSLLPAGTSEISEEEDAAIDLGRRTLLVFIKGSGD